MVVFRLGSMLLLTGGTMLFVLLHLEPPSQAGHQADADPAGISVGIGRGGVLRIPLPNCYRFRRQSSHFLHPPTKLR
jgi:hypothetical protein